MSINEKKRTNINCITEGKLSWYYVERPSINEVKYLADKAEAYWLIDAIASWQVEKKVRNCPFQIWELKVNKDRTAILTMKEDTDEPELVKQKIPYTDFPLDYQKLYLVDRVLMLPSEY